MTGINLQDGLEAWYEFDSNYFDAQRNVIEDQSGYGRHAEASGGPTVGVNGPNDFEATSFDGSDDEFIIPEGATNNIAESGEITICILIDGWTVGNSSIASYGRFGADIATGSNSPDAIRFELWDGGAALYSVTDHNNRVAVGTYDGETVKIYLDDRVSTSEYTGGLRDKTGEKSTIMSTTDVDRHTDGSVAFTGYWSRALSDAEVKQLLRLTSPRRAML